MLTDWANGSVCLFAALPEAQKGQEAAQRNGPEEVADLITAPSGLASLITLGAIQLAGLCTIVWFERQRGRVPSCVDAFMAILYPASLGVDEGLAIMCMRATTSMFAHCNEAGVGLAACDHWAFWSTGTAWTIFGFGTLPYLHVVFGRFETTLALPIEYGIVNIAMVASGLILYQEHKYMLSTMGIMK